VGVAVGGYDTAQSDYCTEAFLKRIVEAAQNFPNCSAVALDLVPMKSLWVLKLSVTA
jgi:hypothetical protein